MVEKLIHDINFKKPDDPLFSEKPVNNKSLQQVATIYIKITLTVRFRFNLWLVLFNRRSCLLEYLRRSQQDRFMAATSITSLNYCPGGRIL
jgi:hypothetical protein